MKKNLILRVFFTIIIFFVLILFFKLNIKDTTIQDKTEMINEKVESSNIIKDVSYISKDSKGNEYRLEAAEGEIDQNESNYIFLTTVKGSISLSKYNLIEISSDSGKYNINNYDTIFSKNVTITYLDNIIKGEHLDFSWEKSLMTISKNVFLENDKSSLSTDVIELNMKTRDIKIFMYEENKKVKIKSFN
tara:strand:- start:65 stop:634 length:570 start_codon:yes stop_codon:yes gene_type:complete